MSRVGPRSHASSRGNKLGYYRASLACEVCRKRKIRCLPPIDEKEGRCATCARLGRQCNVVTVDRMSFSDTSPHSSTIPKNQKNQEKKTIASKSRRRSSQANSGSSGSQSGASENEDGAARAKRNPTPDTIIEVPGSLERMPLEIRPAIHDPIASYAPEIVWQSCGIPLPIAGSKPDGLLAMDTLGHGDQVGADLSGGQLEDSFCRWSELQVASWWLPDTPENQFIHPLSGVVGTLNNFQFQPQEELVPWGNV